MPRDEVARSGSVGSRALSPALRVAMAATLAAAVLAPSSAASEDVEPGLDRPCRTCSTRPDPFPASTISPGGRRGARLAGAERIRPIAASPIARRRSAIPAPACGRRSSRVTKCFSAVGRAGAARREVGELRRSESLRRRSRQSDQDARLVHSFRRFEPGELHAGQFLSPLVAQNRTYTRYEVRFNEAEFNSIVDHRLDASAMSCRRWKRRPISMSGRSR